MIRAFFFFLIISGQTKKKWKLSTEKIVVLQDVNKNWNNIYTLFEKKSILYYSKWTFFTEIYSIVEDVNILTQQQFFLIKIQFCKMQNLQKFCYPFNFFKNVFNENVPSLNSEEGQLFFGSKLTINIPFQQLSFLLSLDNSIFFLKTPPLNLKAAPILAPNDTYSCISNEAQAIAMLVRDETLLLENQLDQQFNSFMFGINYDLFNFVDDEHHIYEEAEWPLSFFDPITKLEEFVNYKHWSDSIIELRLWAELHYYYTWEPFAFFWEDIWKPLFELFVSCELRSWTMQMDEVLMRLPQKIKALKKKYSKNLDFIFPPLWFMQHSNSYKYSIKIFYIFIDFATIKKYGNYLNITDVQTYAFDKKFVYLWNYWRPEFNWDNDYFTHFWLFKRLQYYWLYHANPHFIFTSRLTSMDGQYTSFYTWSFYSSLFPDNALQGSVLNNFIEFLTPPYGDFFQPGHNYMDGLEMVEWWRFQATDVFWGDFDSFVYDYEVYNRAYTTENNAVVWVPIMHLLTKTTYNDVKDFDMYIKNYNKVFKFLDDPKYKKMFKEDELFPLKPLEWLKWFWDVNNMFRRIHIKEWWVLGLFGYNSSENNLNYPHWYNELGDSSLYFLSLNYQLEDEKWWDMFQWSSLLAMGANRQLKNLLPISIYCKEQPYVRPTLYSFYYLLQEWIWDDPGFLLTSFQWGEKPIVFNGFSWNGFSNLIYSEQYPYWHFSWMALIFKKLNIFWYDHIPYAPYGFELANIIANKIYSFTKGIVHFDLSLMMWSGWSYLWSVGFRWTTWNEFTYSAVEIAYRLDHFFPILKDFNFFYFSDKIIFEISYFIYLTISKIDMLINEGLKIFFKHYLSNQLNILDTVLYNQLNILNTVLYNHNSAVEYSNYIILNNFTNTYLYFLTNELMHFFSGLKSIYKSFFLFFENYPLYFSIFEIEKISILQLINCIPLVVNAITNITKLIYIDVHEYIIFNTTTMSDNVLNSFVSAAAADNVSFTWTRIPNEFYFLTSESNNSFDINTLQKWEMENIPTSNFIIRNELNISNLQPHHHFSFYVDENGILDFEKIQDFFHMHAIYDNYKSLTTSDLLKDLQLNETFSINLYNDETYLIDYQRYQTYILRPKLYKK